MAFKLTPTQEYYDLKKLFDTPLDQLNENDKGMRQLFGDRTFDSLTIKQELGNYYQYDPAYLTSSDREILKYKDKYKLNQGLDPAALDPFTPIILSLTDSGGKAGYSSGIKNALKPNNDIYGSSASYTHKSLGLPKNIEAVNARIAKRGSNQAQFTDEELTNIINGGGNLDNPDRYKMVDYHMQAMDFMLKQIDDLENRTIGNREKYLGTSDKILALNKDVEELNKIVDAQNAEVDKYTKNKEDTKRLKAAARAATQGIKRK